MRGVIGRMRGTGYGLAGSALTILLLALAGAAALLLPFDTAGMDLGSSWSGPSAAHPLGCDGLGRDVASRLIAGIGTTLAVTALALVLAAGTAAMLGGLAGWMGGRVDALVMRTADLLHGFPDLALAILVSVALGPGGVAVVLTLVIAACPAQVRLCRALVLSQRTGEHVAAATALGAGPVHTVLRHVLPAAAGAMAVRAAIMIGPAIVTEATLSGLGLGIQEPGVSLGTMFRDGLSDLRAGFHVILSTTAVVAAITLAANLLAEALLDGLDPRRARGFLRMR